VVPVAIAAGALLLYICFQPLIKKRPSIQVKVPHDVMKHLETLSEKKYNRIAVTIDFTSTDAVTIQHAVTQGGKDAKYLLIHIVETAGAIMMGSEIKDFETSSDFENLEAYAMELRAKGFDCKLQIGYGNPKKDIPVLVKEFDSDLLVMGAHGHHAWKDFLFGTTVNSVRHRVKIPVLIVR
jgi:manganese transport protein